MVAQGCCVPVAVIGHGKAGARPLEFGVLGPFTASAGTQRLDLGGPRRRWLLAMRLVHASKTVSTARLVDAVWEERPPATTEATLRSHVANLRRTLGVGVGVDAVVTRPPY